MVSTVHESYLAWALIGQNKFTVQIDRDWTTASMYSSTADPSIMCAPKGCLGSVKMYSSAQLCTQKYSSYVQVVYSNTLYLYMNLYCNSPTQPQLKVGN